MNKTVAISWKVAADSTNLVNSLENEAIFLLIVNFYKIYTVSFTICNFDGQCKCLQAYITIHQYAKHVEC